MITVKTGPAKISKELGSHRKSCIRYENIDKALRLSILLTASKQSSETLSSEGPEDRWIRRRLRKANVDQNNLGRRAKLATKCQNMRTWMRTCMRTAFDEVRPHQTLYDM